MHWWGKWHFSWKQDLEQQGCGGLDLRMILLWIPGQHRSAESTHGACHEQFPESPKFSFLRHEFKLVIGLFYGIWRTECSYSDIEATVHYTVPFRVILIFLFITPVVLATQPQWIKPPPKRNHWKHLSVLQLGLRPFFSFRSNWKSQI